MVRIAPTVLRFSAAGTLLGVFIGCFRWSRPWPELSGLNLLWTATAGWLVGLAVGCGVAMAFRSRSRDLLRSSRGPWQRAGAAALVVVGLAPGAVWLALPMTSGGWRGVGPMNRLRDDCRPNIILIGIDALRADHVGAYGSAAGLTPNLDAFAREATVYRSAYASSPWTLTSMGALASSLPPSRCVVARRNGEDPRAYTFRAALLHGAPLVAESLQQAGYRTAAELTNPFLTQRYGWERGFDCLRNEDGSDTSLLLTSQTTRGEVVTEHARGWLALNRKEPFLLWLHYLDPHAPYDSPDTPEGIRKQYPPNWETRRTYWYEEMAGASPEERARYQEFCRRMYAKEVRYADRCVGGLLAELKRRRLYDGSLIVIFSDHGEELFDHGAFEHGHTLHEEVLHVPLLVKWPKGTEADPIVTQTVSLASLAPTVLEMAGLAKQAGGAASSLPRRDGGPGEMVYSEAPLYGPDQTALTTDHYKVIYHLSADGGDASFEIYDRRHDVGERLDLAAGRAAVELRDRLREMTEGAQKARREASRDEARGGDLDEATKRRLRSLGYLSE